MNDPSVTPGRLALMVALGVALLFAAVLPPIVLTPDENSMLAVAVSLVEGRGMTVPAALGIAGRGGAVYSSWYPLNSLLAVPVVAIAKGAATLAHLPVAYVAAPFAVAWVALLTAGTCALITGTVCAWGGTRAAAVAAAITYAFGTIVQVYGRSFFAESLLAGLTAVAIFAATTSTARVSRLEMVAAALAVLAKPAGIVVGIALCLFHLASGRVVRTVASAAATVSGLLAYLAYNTVRFGSPFTFGQPWGSFHVSVVPEALAGMLASPGRGLVWYSPVIGLALYWIVRDLVADPTRLRQPSGLAVLVFLGQLGLHSLWDQWAGGWSWGSRFLVPAFPGLLAAAAASSRFRLRILAPFAVCGAVISSPILLTTVSRTIAESRDTGVSTTAQLWSASGAPVSRAWSSAVAQVRAAQRSDVRQVLATGGVSDASVADAQSFRILPVWWWMLPLAGLPRWLGAAIAVCLAVAGAAALARAAMLAGARSPATRRGR